ncbi:MAG: alpha/beta fold hydrolase [Pseudomonadota bacterium]
MARLVPLFVALLAVCAVALALVRLAGADGDVRTQNVVIGDTPATIYRAHAATPLGKAPPVVVIAHGFAGSRTLMAPFATALAKNGYVAVTFDFLGHGEHPRPLTGDVTAVEGATRALIEQTAEVARYAGNLEGTGDGLAVLGHSMASDIVVRFAKAHPVDATIAVSMFSPAVTAREPANLLVIVGAWEAGLAAEALRAVGLASAPQPAVAGVTYGDFALGTARRAAFSAQSEHIAVLFNEESLREAVMWLDKSFALERVGEVATSPRLEWIALLVVGLVALGWPLSKLLPVLARPRTGAGLRWRALWPVIVVPMVATPLLLRVLPTDFLPVVVGDYLATHFLLYGLLTALMLPLAGRLQRGPSAAAHRPAAQPTVEEAPGRASRMGLVLATLAVALWSLGALGLVVDTYVTNYQPVTARLPLLGALLAGTLAYFLATEWASRGDGAARGGYMVAKLAFVISLAIAVALDFERLFFLIIIVPVIALYFVIYGLFSRWSYRRTGHPVPGAVGNAVVFGWAITVTFPMLAG